MTRTQRVRRWAFKNLQTKTAPNWG